MTESHVAPALRLAQNPAVGEPYDIEPYDSARALRMAQGLKPSPQALQGLDVTRLRQARRLFCHPLAPRSVQRHNIRQWVKSLRLLGYKWLLARR